MLKLLGGRKGGATQGGKSSSHVHKSGKQQANKAIRAEQPPYKITTPCHNEWGDNNSEIFYGIDYGMEHECFLTDIDPEEGDR